MREKHLIAQELGINKNQCIKATSKPYSFRYVNKPMKKIMRNFAIIASKQDDVSSDAYDNAFIVENGKIKFNTDIDMRMNKI